MKATRNKEAEDAHTLKLMAGGLLALIVLTVVLALT